MSIRPVKTRHAHKNLCGRGNQRAKCGPGSEMGDYLKYAPDRSGGPGNIVNRAINISKLHMYSSIY